MLTIIPWARVDLLFFSLNIDVNLFLVFFSFFSYLSTSLMMKYTIFCDCILKIILPFVYIERQCMESSGPFICLDYNNLIVNFKTSGKYLHYIAGKPKRWNDFELWSEESAKVPSGGGHADGEVRDHLNDFDGWTGCLRVEWIKHVHLCA